MAVLVATCSDDHYALGVGALFASILRFNPAARLVLVDLGISSGNLAALQAIAAEAGGRIEVLALSPERVSHLSVSRHISVAAYARLLLPDLLPGDSRCLYLDCDMVVTGPLDDLWQTDLGGLPLGAVPVGRSDPAELASLGLPEAGYVNSGLLLMDLDVWRQEGWTARCLAFAEARGGDLLYHDQSTINAVMAGAIVHLPQTYNMAANHRRIQWRIPRIIHFKSAWKPWNSAPLLGPVWWHFIEPYLHLFDAGAVAKAQAGRGRTPPRRRSLVQNLRRDLLRWLVLRRCLSRLARTKPRGG